MKTVLFCLLSFFLINTISAQTEAETLEWLNIKKLDMSIAGSFSSTVPKYSADTLLIKKYSLRLSNDKGAWTEITWTSIKEIKKEGSTVKVISGSMYKNMPVFISLAIYNVDLLGKVHTAIKHMATLNNAKLIDSDLF